MLDTDPSLVYLYSVKKYFKHYIKLFSPHFVELTMLPILLIILLKLVPDATGKIYQIGYLTDSQGASSSF